MTYRTIKIDEKLYNELNDIKTKTNIPLTKIVEFAFNNFKQSKEYAHLVLFAKCDFKVNEKRS
ncbi:MAG: ribbon-helix-helix domain-containing protein [Christensenellales bacterium]